MKLAIFGATGNTGTELVKQALEKGHQVTAFVRSSSNISIKHDQLDIVTGDVFLPESVAGAVQGQDAVICALGSRDLKKTSIRTAGTSNIVQVMKEHNVQRLLVVSAMGTGESWNTLSLVNKFFYATLLRSSRDDHEAQEDVVKTSGLDWTIIRPSGLTDDARTGVYAVGENVSGQTFKIARADVADLILRELEENSLIHKAVTITN